MLLVVVGAATYFEFIYTEFTVYAVLLRLLVVPLLFASTVTGVRDQPLYKSLAYVGFIAVGVLQYLDGEWVLLAGVFILAGRAGLVADRLRQASPAVS